VGAAVSAFAVTSATGSAAAFHARVIGDEPEPEVWVFEVDRPAVVLGSTQRADVVDERACADAGVEIVRRRSGGGAVLLEPGAVVWFDVVVPAGVLRAAGVGDDVGASMGWLGEHVAGALAALGVGGVAVHHGAMACSSWCPLVCFAGLGPGEVLRDGRKLVGISQRRTRAGSRFQCAVHERWSPERLLALLAGDLPAGDPPPVGTLPAPTARALPGAVAAALSG
jgi:lipoate-protein ligase A